MSKISARMIEHSINSSDIEIATMQLCYPRFIHGEFMTHRVFSRNASSSRAIPVMKMLKQVWSNPAMPVHWGVNKPGMQADKELGGVKKWLARKLWVGAGRVACSFAWLLMKLGSHKQVANRITEPWQYINVILTSTEWDNFFELRDHPDAQPEIRELAKAMKEAKELSIAKMRFSDPSDANNWHLPYVLPAEREEYRDNPDLLVRMSAARCARVSYLTHDGKNPDQEKDISLFSRLVGSAPIHASPIEHQAYPDRHTPTFGEFSWIRPDLHGNFRGWVQFRKLYEGTIFRNQPKK